MSLELDLKPGTNPSKKRNDGALAASAATTAAHSNLKISCRPEQKQRLAMASLYTVKGILILDNDCNRLLVKYYDDTFPTIKEQRAFEKNLFQKTHRANSEIVMFDGITCVYRSNVDLFFYVFGSSQENELILGSVLSSYYDAISMVLRENIEKIALLDNLDSVMLITDEIVDGGILLESEPTVLARGAVPTREDVPLSEQTLSQALNTAGGILRRSLLT